MVWTSSEVKDKLQEKEELKKRKIKTNLETLWQPENRRRKEKEQMETSNLHRRHYEIKI